ncbi:GDP-mannose-dependent alpha-mannosyltransferase [Acinetobacter stercoris]|uniref:GDP-mannose-dependent alpha-mannosyltransferase n=2 Tax=Acinetobacter stercoris TaxID=2126983 RepID=A0A2U3MX00_9GAMM|nr:GDP-mannose-dependent alpha-mannosyltransferase [Acinetobacter stercoris]
MGDRMAGSYTESLFYKQIEFPESFQFYFKQKQNNAFAKNNLEDLQDLVRPRLKIAIVTETWPPEINGVALSLLQLCKGLQKLGHKILLVRPEQKHICNEFKPNKECLVNAQSIPKYPTLQFGWPQYLKVSQAFTEFAPDIVHIVTEGPLGLTALQVARSKRIPVSSGFHSPFQDFSRFFDLAFLVKPVQRYLRWFHNNTQLTCVPSQGTYDALRAFGIHCPLVVVGRGVDVYRFSSEHRSEELRKKWGVTEDTTVMLYVGRLSPEKEIDVLIDAYALMKEKQSKKVKFVVVGEGPDLVRLKDKKGADQVIFMGSLSGKALSEAYASADVFVFASQVETFGNVVLEAMASGLPVVAYDYACAKQHVIQNKMGWLCPLGQTAQFMQMLFQLPDNNVLCKMGVEAMQAVQNTGWKHPVHQLEQALYQVVQETFMVT